MWQEPGTWLWLNLANVFLLEEANGVTRILQPDHYRCSTRSRGVFRARAHAPRRTGPVGIGPAAPGFREVARADPFSTIFQARARAQTHASIHKHVYFGGVPGKGPRTKAHGPPCGSSEPRGSAW